MQELANSLLAGRAVVLAAETRWQLRQAEAAKHWHTWPLWQRRCSEMLQDYLNMSASECWQQQQVDAVIGIGISLQLHAQQGQ